MKDKFNHIERRGLPGGPNEQFTYVTGVFSTDGYRYDSPDVNNIYNVIPSGNISMREKNGEPLKKGPILGIDNLGNKQLMQPGFDYQFPGDQVFELPTAQIGKETKKNTPIKKKFEQRLNNPTLSLKNKDGTYSTHEMISFESDGKYYAAPRIIERNGKLERLSKDDAYNYAMQNKEYKEFKTEKEARAYAQGNYKMGTPLQEKGQLHTYDLDEHVVRAIKLPNVDEDDANWQKQQLKKLKAETQKNKESFDRFSNNFQIGTDLASFVPPLAPYAYAVSVPFTLNDMYSDIVKGDYEQLGKDAIGLIPSFKVAPRVGLKGNYVPKTNKYRTNIINGAFNTANLSVDLDKKALGGLLMAQKGKYIPPNFSDFNYGNVATAQDNTRVAFQERLPPQQLTSSVSKQYIPPNFQYIPPNFSDFDYGQTALESTSRTYNSRELNRPVSTATPSVSKQQVVESVQEAQRLRKIQEDERRARIADSEAAKKTPYTLQNFPEVFARETQAIGDKLQSAYIPDILNPAMMLGDLASGLGRVPLNIQQGNYGQAALNIGMPLAIGAFAGLGAKTTGQFVNNLVNPLAGIGSKKPPVSSNAFDLNELRRVYHNSERFLMPEEARYLHKHGHGLRENYRTSNSVWNNQQNLSDEQLNTLSDIVQHNNQLPLPPSEIQFIPDGTTRNIYNQLPITDYISGSYIPDYIDLRRPTQYNRDLLSADYANLINGYPEGSSFMNYPNLIREEVEQIWRNLNNRVQPAVKPKSSINKSGLTKDEVLAKVSAKDKDAVSKMSETEFENTVLKPTGEIVPYESRADLMSQFTGNNNVFAMSPREYADRFNERLDLLDDIIAQRNKSGVEYKVKGIDEYGNLTFYTPPGQKIKTPPPIKNKSFSEIMNTPLSDFFSKSTVIPEGESIWSVNINPGQWRGNVEDIANTEYFRSIPGLEMSNTTQGVFADKVPRKGSGAYESINEYLKRLDLGRVKPGFNSQTEFSRGAWENFIKSGRGVGFYANPRTVYGTMKSVFPYIGAGYLGYEGLQGALQEKSEYKTGGDTNQPKYQTGNEIAFDIYKKYINGDYIGTLEEGKAKKTYDRLNRIYYKDAKSSGMSVPNYIMTNVVTLQ